MNRDFLFKSKGRVISRDRDIVIIKVLKNIKSKSFFKLGGGVCTETNDSLRGLILELSIRVIRILLLDQGSDIKNKTILYSSSKFLAVRKNLPGYVYSGVGELLWSYQPEWSNDKSDVLM